MVRHLIKPFLWSLLLAIPLVPCIVLGQNPNLTPLGFAALPLDWVDMFVCNPPSDLFDVDVTLGQPPFNDPLTPAGLITAQNRWDGTTWYRIKVPAGTNIHGPLNTTSPDGTKVVLYAPVRTGVTKCLRVDSDNPNPLNKQVCGGGLPGYGGTRAPGCTPTDLAHMWTLTADSNSFTGAPILYAQASANHVEYRNVEITVKPGAFQSGQAGANNTPQAAELDGDTVGITQSYWHGWDPGDAGQHAAGLGVCPNWTMTGTVNTVNSDGSHGTVTWASNIVSGKETSKRFGSTFSDGVHSPGFPQALIEIPAGSGTKYAISTHDPVSTDQVLTVSGQPGTQTAVAYSLTNPMMGDVVLGLPDYSVGCGDDIRGVAFNCTHCWMPWDYAEKIHFYNNDIHAIGSGFSQGPYRIVGGWFEASSEDYFSGGGAVDQRGGPANDGEIRRSFFGRDINWRWLSAGSGKSPGPPFGCGPLDGNDPAGSHDNCPMAWSIKNNVEAKLGHRLLFQGNIIGPTWPDGQSGYCCLQTARTISGGATAGIFDPLTGEPLTAINNVRWESNWVQGSAQAFQMATRSSGPGNGGGVSQPIHNMDYVNLVFSNINDPKQWGNPGNDLFQWGGAGGNLYLCSMSRPDGLVAHAACLPPKLANYNIGIDPTLDSSFDISSVVKGTVGGVAHTVTVKLNGLRHDPTVGGQFTMGNVAGWNGTFTITGALNNGVPASADGTLGDTLLYVDNVNSGTPDGSLCTTFATCNTHSIQSTTDTLAYKIVDMAVGDNVYTHNCTNSSYNVGQDAAHASLVVSPTIPSSLDVYFTNPGPVDSGSGVTCLLENNSGFPRNVTYQYNTVIALGNVAINSAGTYKQHNNNKFYHNIFVIPTGGSTGILSCNGTGEGKVPLSTCWLQSNLEEFDNVLVGRSSANWDVFPGGSLPNSFPTTVDCNITPTSACLGWSGYMTSGSFSLTPCAAPGGNPADCAFMPLPWKDNFRLSKLRPVLGSSYLTQGANIDIMEAAFVSNGYTCPIGANCGMHGPYPDAPVGPGGPSQHTFKGAVKLKGAFKPK